MKHGRHTLVRLFVISATISMGLLRADETAVLRASGRQTQQTALNAIFGSELLAQNVRAVRSRAADMSPPMRLEFLTEWVLPADTDPAFRLSMEFTPVNPVALVDDESHAEGDSHIEQATSRRRMIVGGDLVSPAIDLVTTARQLGVLSDLKWRILNSPGNDATAERCRRTMIILTEIAAGRFKSAEVQLAELQSRFVQMDRSQVTIRCPETLAIFAGVQDARTRDIAQDMLSYIVDSFIRQQRSESQDVWDRQMAALAGWAKSLADSPTGAEETGPLNVLPNWVPVSRATAQSRGLGFPHGRWQPTRGRVQNVACHDQDYLYYGSPLRGSFQVECDVTGFNWRHSHLAVVGQWVAPVWGMGRIEIGNFRQNFPYIEMVPPLSPAGDWIRYRTVVRDGTAATYFNGRRVHSRSLDADHEPWVAVRSPWYAEGEVRDLRITGQPEIPQQLNLSASPGLPGWMSYQNTQLGSDWHQSVTAEIGGLIVGDKRREHIGTGYESLLQYNRPMLEDGTIEYGFYYDEGDVHVHPALDRLTFLLQPDGVRIHHVTDGRWDMTDADPLTVFDERESRRGPGRLPLRQNEWNDLKLQLSGDTVQLTLNNQLVFERDLEATNQRTFGLFHYSGQTQARVRNVTWKGDWPKVVPSPEMQELADPAPLFPELALKDVFRHDFAKEGMPPHLFSQGGFSIPGNTLQVVRGGLSMRNESSQDFTHCFLAPNLEAHGDFDIIAAFDALRTVSAENGASGIALEVRFADDLSTQASVYRGFVRRPGAADVQTAHLYIHRTKAKEAQQSWLGSIAEESESGRLRLIRRGDLLYSLIAEGDAPHFRLVSSEKVPDTGLIPGGVRLKALGNASETNVVWTQLEIRAAELSGPATEDSAEQLAELNLLRDRLPQRWTHDFTKFPPATHDFSRWTDAEPWKEPDGGLRIVCPGNEAWISAGFHLQKSISGDFDISTRFAVLELLTPDPGLLSNVLFQIHFRDKDQVRPTLVINRRDTGRTTVQAELWVPRPEGGFTYRQIGAFEAEAGNVSGFRFVRQDHKLFYVVSSTDFSRDRVLGKVAVPDLPILPADVSFRVMTGGNGRATTVLSTLIDLRAEDLSARLMPE